MRSGMFDTSRYNLEAGIMSILEEGSPRFERCFTDWIQPKPPANLKSLGVLP